MDQRFFIVWDTDKDKPFINNRFLPFKKHAN